MKKHLLLLAAFITLSAFSQTPDIYYVNHLQNGNGTSWENAYGTLQEALDAASPPAEIWVAEGTYSPTSTYDLNNEEVAFRHFRMKNGVAIYGGFTGYESYLGERDWKQNQTVLSGTSKGEGISCHLFYNVGIALDETAVLDGFIVFGGRADLSDENGWHGTGGGMLNAPEITSGSPMTNMEGVEYLEGTESSPTVSNCIFISNKAVYGGGMANLFGSNPTITNCSFLNNGAVEGGGMYNYQSEPFVANCFFEENNSLKTGRNAFPGAVGYGTDSRGAYANSATPAILIVDTLDPGNFSTGENRGTFMWAVTRNYPRIVLFEVSGVIDYSEIIWRVQIERPYLSVYGQSAPGKGITIKGATLWIQSNDMVFQHLRFKVGDHDHGRDPNAIDALSFYHGANHIVFDHCTFSWSVDELVGSKASNQNITFSNCIFSEPLDKCWHLKEGTGMAERHPYGCLMYAGNLTFYRNLFAYSYGRNPLIRQAGNHIINNYNYCTLWAGPMLENIGHDIHAAVVGNHIDNIPFDGNIRSAGNYLTYVVNSLTAGSRLYVEDNICREKTENPGLDEWDYVVGRHRTTEAQTPTIDLDEFDIIPSGMVKEHVLSNAGAIPWNRDLSDQNVIDKIRADAQGELRHSVYDYPATARNVEGTATSGNLLYGYNWSDNPQYFEISYNETNEGDIIGPATVTLDQNCESIIHVVDYLNTILPNGLEAVRNGPASFPGNMVFIRTTHSGDDAFIEIHDGGTAHATFGIPSNTFYGRSYVGYDYESGYAVLEIPEEPHADNDGNGFTNLQEWICHMHEPMGRRGGGMMNSNSSPTLVNCVFSGNYAFEQGAGMLNQNAGPEIVNCTFSRNSSYHGAGGIANYAASPVVINSIIYGNNSSMNELGEVDNAGGGSPEYNFCNIKGSGGSSNWDPAIGSDGGNNIDADPEFITDGDHSFSLSETSPCIDAGSNLLFEQSVKEWETITDIRGEGWPRIMAADGISEGGAVDIGAYEFNSDSTFVGGLGARKMVENMVVSIFPNPANSFLMVQIDSKVNGEFIYRISDLTGRFIDNGVITNSSVRINLEEISAGIYLLFVIHDGCIVKSERVFIQ